jgi:hypothetical protein
VRVAGETSGWLLSTRETVAIETPASSATSWMVTRGLFPSSRRLTFATCHPCRVCSIYNSLPERARISLSNFPVLLYYSGEITGCLEGFPISFGNFAPENASLASASWKSDEGVMCFSGLFSPSVRGFVGVRSPSQLGPCATPPGHPMAPSTENSRKICGRNLLTGWRPSVILSVNRLEITGRPAGKQRPPGRETKGGRRQRGPGCSIFGR